MRTRRYFWGKERPARKAENLTAIYEPTDYTMWDPRRLITLQASMTFYRDSFILLSFYVLLLLLLLLLLLSHSVRGLSPRANYTDGGTAETPSIRKGWH
jgi:hypothetical protein